MVTLGMRLWFSTKDPGKMLLISLIAYWIAIHVVFFGDPRFHAPIMPIAALLAAPALVALWSGKEPWNLPGGRKHSTRVTMTRADARDRGYIEAH